jgi:hypothetical protein
MNQPSEIVPVDPSTITSAAPTSPLMNLFKRLHKSEKARRKTRGAFGRLSRYAKQS